MHSMAHMDEKEDKPSTDKAAGQAAQGRVDKGISLFARIFHGSYLTPSPMFPVFTSQPILLSLTSFQTAQ